MKFEKYPFEKLNALLSNVDINHKKNLISLTIGEPQFQTPKLITQALEKHSCTLNKYPKTAGESFLNEAQRGFMKRNFGIKLKKEELIPTFGTREVLFNFPQFLLKDIKKPKMAFVNPFYQIYEGAAIASRAKILHLNLEKKNGFKPQIYDKILKDCDLVILNSPNNPTASCMDLNELTLWVKKALQHNFVLLNDECYSEIYTNKRAPSLLNASINANNADFKNVIVINSISKRSSAPGLRSGFIAGDAKILKGYLQYRTYVGCASPLPLQYASAAAWADEKHVKFIRQKYQKNLQLAREILGVNVSEYTFYVWLRVKNDEKFTKKLYKNESVKVLPGSYLGRDGIGKDRVRLALVYEPEITKEALIRIKNFKGRD